MFQKLNKKVKELVDKRDWEEPTLPQEKAIPEIVSGKNVLVIAETGVGKTEACCLPIFSRWIDEKPEPTSVLYITPLRALNRDILKRLLWWGKKLDMDVSVRHGDTTQYERTKQAEFPPDLLITTPETLQAVLPGSKMKKNLSHVKYVVVDEIHELVSSKRGTQLSIALERLRKMAGDFQIIGLSATVGSPKKVAKFLDKDMEVIRALSLKNLEINIFSPKAEKKDRELSENIFLGAEATARLRRIYSFIRDKKSLVFTNTREAAEILSSRLRRLEYEGHAIHHSSLSKDVRVSAEDNFKNGDLDALVCTSSLELGIDIGTIQQVVQYMSPRQVSKLVQRVGRSGHKVGDISKGMIIASGPDDILEAGVITKNAFKGNLEETKFHEASLDVLAHQIIGMALEEYNRDWKEMYELVKKAYPYRNLTKKKFSSILKYLKNMWYIYLDTKVRRKRKAWKYYYNNLSTIPDVFNYRVIDNIENKEVGVLDEGFVAEHGEPGTTFIVKGSPWRILSVDRGKVLVEPVEDITSAVPAWEGELIPVPKEIAQEVGEIRKKVSKMIEKEKEDKKIIKDVQKEYPISKEACRKVIDYIKEQRKKQKIVPTDEKILVESDGKFVVIHSCAGTLINQTFSRFLSALLISDLGRSVSVKCDPYRIMIEGVNKEKVLDIINQNDAEDFEIIIDNTLEKTQMFKWRLIHVAKRFGAIRRDAKWDRMNIKKLVKSFRNTPIFEEAKKEVYLEKLDVKGAKKYFQKIKDNKIEVVVGEDKNLSPIGEVGVQYQFRELIGPEKPEKEIFEVFKNRLLTTKVRLVCMRCGEYSLTKPVKMIKEDPECPSCDSKFITVIKPYEREKEKIIKKNVKDKPLSEEEKKKLERMESAADLVLTYGKKVITALAGRGVGPDTAIRILAKQRETKEKFLKDILRAERKFARTKRFWS